MRGKAIKITDKGRSYLELTDLDYDTTEVYLLQRALDDGAIATYDYIEKMQWLVDNVYAEFIEYDENKHRVVCSAKNPPRPYNPDAK